ncbi:MAG: hypothetical protein HXS48_24940 [Theionarchaea archaeon]|nr:hypothetical protein [Theionarchaea archaeon]
MKELITMAFRQVRGIQKIHLPEESPPMFTNTVENLREVLSIHRVDHILIEGNRHSFYVMFSNDRWIGVTTDRNVNEVIIRAALERAVKFLEKHSQVEQRMKHIKRDIEEYFVSVGVDARVRRINLSVESDSVSGKIQLSAREGRAEAVKEQLRQFLERQLPYFIKNKVDIIIEKQGLLDRITRDQLLRIIRRVERL